MKAKDKQLGMALDQKKKVTIVKCFLCNQFFYSQITFDSHMKTHQSKLNRNIPQQIQRKTQQSFGIRKKQSINKKNTTLQSISPNQIMQKKMNKTQQIQKNIKNVDQKLERPFSKQIINYKRQEDIKDKNLNLSPSRQANQKQVQQINEALRQSSIIMNQIMFLTQCEVKQEKLDSSLLQMQVESDEQLQKNISQNQFVKKISQQQNIKLDQIQFMILRTAFQTKTLQNCQIQLEHLQKLLTFATNDEISKTKILKIKSKILSQILKDILFCNEKSTQIKNQKVDQRQQKIIKVENIQLRSCSECYSNISYGEQCILKGNRCFHQECYSQQIEN